MKVLLIQAGKFLVWKSLALRKVFLVIFGQELRFSIGFLSLRDLSSID
jgi:hypothetical protein